MKMSSANAHLHKKQRHACARLCVCVCVYVCSFMEKSRVSTAAKSCHAIDSVATLLFIVIAAAAAAQLKHNYK